MESSASALTQLMDSFAGGSPGVYLHPVNQQFTFTEGVYQAARSVNARWLVDLVAMKMAPLYAKAWLEGNASVGIITLEVYKPGEHPGVAGRITLSLLDNQPPAFVEQVSAGDFPPGTWKFYLATDAAQRSGQYITNLYLPQEH